MSDDIRESEESNWNCSIRILSNAPIMDVQRIPSQCYLRFHIEWRVNHDRSAFKVFCFAIKIGIEVPT